MLGLSQHATCNPAGKPKPRLKSTPEHGDGDALASPMPRPASDFPWESGEEAIGDRRPGDRRGSKELRASFDRRISIEKRRSLDIEKRRSFEAARASAEYNSAAQAGEGMSAKYGGGIHRPVPGFHVPLSVVTSGTDMVHSPRDLPDSARSIRISPATQLTGDNITPRPGGRDDVPAVVSQSQLYGGHGASLGTALQAAGYMRPSANPSSPAALALVEVAPLTDYGPHNTNNKHSSVRSSVRSSSSSSGDGKQEGAASRPIPASTLLRSASGRLDSNADIGDVKKLSRPRQWCVTLTAHPDFEMIITLVIFANTITLCLYNPGLADREGMNGHLFWTGMYAL